jgi:hypothetical protein
MAAQVCCCLFTHDIFMLFAERVRLVKNYDYKQTGSRTDVMYARGLNISASFIRNRLRIWYQSVLQTALLRLDLLKNFVVIKEGMHFYKILFISTFHG